MTSFKTRPDDYKADPGLHWRLINHIFLCLLLFILDSHLMGVNPLHNFQAISADLYCLGNKNQYQYQLVSLCSDF